MNDTGYPHPDKAVLFADISDSTRLYETLGDAHAFTTINSCLDILRRLTAAHTGQTVKTIGDEIMAVFPDAVSAVQAACEMQLVISHARIDGTQLSIRIGLHYGPVITSDGDVFGETVNIAARMTEIAQAQQIITTGATVAMLPPIMRTSTRSFDNLSIKGKTDDIEVHEVIWQESEEMTMMVGRTLSPANAEPTLQLIYRGNIFVMDAAHPCITIGRGELADIMIQDRRASRMHARIERRRDKFVFIDLSSNGSYVTFRNESEVQLRREELVLRESGTISLGHTYKKDPAEVIAFVCKS
ncbi:MAG: adenylate/guanylate cyclase domain-containing protein [Sideroxyarcus sp.]|nr:adenylate/guanylate cyclase domain-containing protein [Sideroxyarcus sp.]